jgi:hypothetical protein
VVPAAAADRDRWWRAAACAALALAAGCAPARAGGRARLRQRVRAAGEFALLPVVARAATLVRANGRVEFARYAGSILGPCAGGLLAAAGGATGALLADAATFLALAAVAPRCGSSGGRTRTGRASACARGSPSSPATPSWRRCGVVFVSLLLMTATPGRGRCVAERQRRLGRTSVTQLPLNPADRYELVRAALAQEPLELAREQVA